MSSPSLQTGPDALVTELVRGVPVRCYASRPTSIVAILQDALDTHRDDVLLVDPALGTGCTYGEFAELVEGAAAGLAELAPAGARVAVQARNGLEAAVAIWACARAGLVHVGIPVDSPPARVQALLGLTGAALLLAQPDLTASGLLSTGAAPTGASTGAPTVAPTGGSSGGVVPVRDCALLRSSRRSWDATAALPDQDATYALIATSGTTGGPKAVRVTGRMAGHAAVFYAGALGLSPGDRTAIHLPFAWVSGHLTQLAPAMLSGGSAVTMARFSAGGLCTVAEEHAVTWLDVVPSIFELLLRSTRFALPALASVRLAVFGGAPAPTGTLERVRERLPQLRLVEVYALSETCAPLTCLSDVEALRRPGTVGRPAPYVELRVVDPDGAPVPRGLPGEVQVRSPAVTPGYWPPGDDASGALTPSPLTPDGWLRTRDLGRLDEEGYLTIAGRAVDLIVRGGVNIYPAEVERALLATGQLADALAVGVPSSVAGQSVAALVVARPGRQVDPSVLRRAVRDALGAHAVPRPVRLVEQLPRGGNGKPDRAAALRLLC